VGLGVGKRAALPTAPMILAASMGPTPKISVRVVPDASGSTAGSLSLREAASAVADEHFHARVPPFRSDLCH
jgi:hypothetical protein